MKERWNEVDDVALQQIEAEMAGELSELRAAATVYAERAWNRHGPMHVVRPLVRSAWLAWGTAGLAAAVLTVGGVRAMHRTQMPETRTIAGAPAGTTPQVTDASAVSDEALLEQIQSDLSTGVPEAMQPLAASETRDARGVAAKHSD